MSRPEHMMIRNGKPSDHERIVTVMPEWWGGRDLSASVLKIFFIHFNQSVFIAEIDDELIGFLVGFMSQSQAHVGYIHFAGIHPHYRKSGVARRLFEEFYAVCRANGRSIVKSCTSPVNSLSIKFHRKMGFEIEPGDGIVDEVPVTLDFLGKGSPKVLFRKTLD